MPKPGAESLKKIADIEREQARLKGLLREHERLLKTVEEKALPDSTPYVSFRVGSTVADLGGPPGGIREVFRRDISRIKQQLEILARDAKTVRRHGYQEFVNRQRASVVRIDRRFEAHVRQVLAMARTRGHLTDQELADLQAGADQILDAYVDLLSLDNSEGAIRDVLSQLADTMTLGANDSRIANRAMMAIVNAAKGNLDKSRMKLEQQPSQRNAKQLIRAVTNLELLGDSSGTAQALASTVTWLESQRDAAEKRFRSLPSSENLKIMFQAEINCTQMGGKPIPSPPAGLKRIKAGTEHHMVSRETLSGLSRSYYGSFSYWDVLVRANAQLWSNPDRPPTGKIVIPF